EVEARAACEQLTDFSWAAKEAPPSSTGMRLVLAAIELSSRNLNNSRRYLYEHHNPERYTRKFSQHFSSLEPPRLKNAILSVLHDNNITVGGQDWRGLNGPPTGMRTENGSTDLIVYNDHSELHLNPG